MKRYKEFKRRSIQREESATELMKEMVEYIGKLEAQRKWLSDRNKHVQKSIYDILAVIK